MSAASRFLASLEMVRFIGNQQVRIGLVVPSADPAPELIDLGQAEPFGLVDDHGVGRWNVQAGLDDGGAHQQIDLIVSQTASSPFSSSVSDSRPWATPMRALRHQLY